MEFSRRVVAKMAKQLVDESDLIFVPNCVSQTRSYLLGASQAIFTETILG